jgi:argininosuccinate synthase
MAVQALVPQVTVTPVASVLGSQNVRNADGYTVSDNLWGRSTEAGPLRDPGAVPPAQAFTRWLPPHATPVPAEVHTVAFEAGRPVGIDGESLGLLALIERLDGIGRTFGVGYADSVEDGFVGLKSRAVYEAPAAAALIVAHRDLERFVSTRRQNDFKAVVDKAWTDLVYDGYWFDPQRRSLEAYIRTLDEWATGEVDLLFRSGGVQPVARRSPYGLYDEREAIYRVGQDFAARSSTATAASLSAHMRAAVRRPGSVPTEEAVPAWNA